MEAGDILLKRGLLDEQQLQRTRDAREGNARLDKVAKRRGGEARFESLSATFRAATRLEVGFWDMGLERRI